MYVGPMYMCIYVCMYACMYGYRLTVNQTHQQKRIDNTESRPYNTNKLAAHSSETEKNTLNHTDKKQT